MSTQDIPLVDLGLLRDQVAEEVERGFAEVLASGAYVGGPQVAAFEQDYAAMLGVEHCIGVANGTDAIELALRACGIGAGDEVVAIKAVLSERSDPLYVMALLTDALPDDTSLLGVQIQGSKVSINGLTPNAAALMQQLGSRPELRDVKAPTAATRSPGSPKDVFNIEFTLIEKAAPGSGPASGAIPLPADASLLPASAAAPVASPLSLPAGQSPPLVSAPSDARSAPASSQAPKGSSPLDGPVFGAPDRPSTLPPKTR